MNAPETLPPAHRVPRQIMIEQHASKLEVNAFAASRRANQHTWTVGPTEPALRCQFRAVVSALEHLNTNAVKACLDCIAKGLDAAEIGREDNDLLTRM